MTVQGPQDNDDTEPAITDPEATVEAGQSVEQVPARRKTSAAFVTTMAAVAAFAVTVSALLWLQAPSAHVELVAGPTFDLAAGLEGDVRDAGATTHGPVLMTTVRVEELSNLEWLTASLPWRQRELVPAATPGLGADPGIPVAQMEASKQTAAIVAVEAVDGAAPTQEYGMGARVLEVLEDGPSDAANVELGDVIVSVDGAPTANQEEVIAAIELFAPGSAVTIGLAGFNADDPGRTLEIITDSNGKIGVLIATAFDADSAPITSDTSGVGGSSGGLMLTLAFIDALSPGDLFAGRSVAGTGSIALDGSVGPIQGAEHKTAAASRDGATVFFAPTLNADEALSAADEGLTVVSVSSYVDALKWLCNNGSTDVICEVL